MWIVLLITFKKQEQLALVFSKKGGYPHFEKLFTFYLRKINIF